MNMSKKKSLSKERNEGVKCCADCKRTKTPMWRCGPSGPKSLCNACGIKHNKKKNGMVGVIKGKDKRKNKISTTTGGGGGSGDGKKSKMNGNLSADLKVVVLKRRQRSPMKRRGRRSKKLGEVEQAAMILMALSLGFVFV